MESVEQSRTVYSFGPFRIDTGDRVLSRDSEEVSLTLKAVETLLLLLENAGHVVEKEVILAEVWPDTFVEESTLAQNILTVRKALGKQANGREYIGTMPKRGYRFDAPVSINGKALNGALPAAAPEKTPVSSSLSRLLRLGLAILAGLVVIALVALWFRGRPTPKVAETRMRLAELPFPDPRESPR